MIIWSSMYTIACLSHFFYHGNNFVFYDFDHDHQYFSLCLIFPSIYLYIYSFCKITVSQRDSNIFTAISNVTLMNHSIFVMYQLIRVKCSSEPFYKESYFCLVKFIKTSPIIVAYDSNVSVTYWSTWIK
jgi:hypothetical protein